MISATFGGVALPILITKINRELVPSVTNQTKNFGKNGVKILNSHHQGSKVVIEFNVKKFNLIQLHEARNNLVNILVQNNGGKLIFSDKPNQYYNAYLDGEQSLDFDWEYLLDNTGKLTFLIPDGLAHSVDLTPFTATVNDQGILSVDIDYNGTVETPLEINIKNTSETGYLSAIGVNGEEATFITQLGYVDEANGEVRTKMQTIRPKENGKDFSDWQDASVFYENQSKKIVTTMTTTSNWGGWLGVLPGSFSNSGYSYYGACKELVFDTPMKYCYTWARAWFETGRMGQCGEWCLAYVDEDNHFIAGMAIEKDDAVGNTANIRFLFGDGNGASGVFKTIQYIPSYWIPPNPYGSQGRDTNSNMFDLKKEGAKITYYWYGGYFTHTVPALENKRVKRLQFYVGQYGSQPASKLVTHMGIRDVSVVDLKSQYWVDVPNRFIAGSKVDIRKEDGANIVYRDGIKTLDDLITGSTFPVLKPGKNQIEFGYSSFTSTPPTITGTYRKRWY
ncbi:distal tail protein Dit [Enterococcus cecorum]|uniref:distal tail protein Dit n=1 Tax=Enterococcus cecorum TaxID=44008 RepID=UPI0024929727|nr:distal tail protein Dit [Enterococcus cecorum]CAI3327826.1 phage tail family protein [Enterococcus cecorum]